MGGRDRGIRGIKGLRGGKQSELAVFAAFDLGGSSGDEGGERGAEPVVGVDELVVEAVGADRLFDAGEMLADGFEIGLADGARVEADAAFAFEALEGRGLLQVKFELGLVHDLEGYEVVTLVLDAGEGGLDVFEVLEVIADDGDEAAVGDLGEKLIDGAA